MRSSSFLIFSIIPWIHLVANDKESPMVIPELDWVDSQKQPDPGFDDESMMQASQGLDKEVPKGEGLKAAGPHFANEGTIQIQDQAIPEMEWMDDQKAVEPVKPVEPIKVVEPIPDKKVFEDSCMTQCPVVQSSHELLLEAKAAYFLPINKKFRKVYGGAGIYGLEASFQAWENLYPWISASYFTKTGHSLGLDNPTRIYMIPFGLGLKSFYQSGCWDFYGAAGILGSYVHMEDKSPGVIRTSARWGCGGIFKLGAIYNLQRSFFIDWFTDYSFMRINFFKKHHKVIERHPAHLDGWSIGLGIGYRFGGCCD